jgi:osmotically-inducible protein OsmY
MNASKNRKIAGLLCAAATLLATSASICHAEQSAPAISDGGITAAVESDLRAAKGVSPDSIDVTTSQGIVTLSGSAGNLLSKDRALRVAESIRGVEGVINRIAVTPVSRSDEDIQKDVKMALRLDPATKSYQVTVSVKDATATLSGSVGSSAESKLAARIAYGVKGLKEIQNNLTINYLSTRTDKEIAADVKAALQWDIWVNGDPINASVKDGNVTLSGTTGSVLSQSRAIDDAWVNGVMGVEYSGMKVNPSASDKMLRQSKFAYKTDSEIKSAVEASLLRDPRLSTFSPNVRVEGGAIILSGSIGNLKAKNEAEQDANNVVGGSWVDNLLEVRPDHSPSDAEIQTNLRAVIELDPLLEDSQIVAAVVNGVAYLSGGADDSFQRSEAGDVASRTQGVVSVRNHLKVEPDYTVYNFDQPYYSDYYWPYYSDYGWPYSGGYAKSYGPVLPESDQQISKKIGSAFFWSPFVHSDDIKVSIDGGVVTLTGQVGTWMGRNEADRDARKSGATAVIDKVTVEKGGWF